MKIDYSFFSGEVFANYILQGLRFTFQLTVFAMIIGIIIGTLIALMRLSGRKWLAIPARIYVDFFRSIPLVMLILWFFLLIPLVIKKSIGAEISAYFTFTIFESAYFAEIVRAGIQSVTANQQKAGLAIGLTYWQNMRYIVLPQAFRNMLPVFMTQTIVLFQDTSLVYAVGAYDLLKGFEVAGRNFNRPAEMYLMAAGIYFIICFSLSKMTRVVQRRIRIVR